MEFHDGVLVRTQSIHDHVFPLVAKDRSGGERMAGTAFVIGTNGYALTAGHCLPKAGETLTGMFLIAEMRNGSRYGRWALEPVAAYEPHPTHDVAILRMTTPAHPCAFLRLSPRPRNPETEYQSWGYPERGYDFRNVPEAGRPVPHPDLIYTKGYVRRIVNRPDVFETRGDAFLEVSEVAGAGCSGSPVVEFVLTDKLAKSPKWAVMGIYVGEHTHDPTLIGERHIGGITVGVVAPAADFGTWSPKLLGHSLIEEANPTAEEAASLGLPRTV